MSIQANSTSQCSSVLSGTRFTARQSCSQSVTIQSCQRVLLTNAGSTAIHSMSFLAVPPMEVMLLRHRQARHNQNMCINGHRQSAQVQPAWYLQTIVHASTAPASMHIAIHACNRGIQCLASFEHNKTVDVVQVIPHSFGRSRPPVICSYSMIEAKIDMCNVLNDIAVAQDMLEAKQEDEEEQKPDLPPHPADEKYATLMADLKIVQPSEEEYKIIHKYCQVGHHLSAISDDMLLQQWQAFLMSCCTISAQKSRQHGGKEAINRCIAHNKE